MLSLFDYGYYLSRVLLFSIPLSLTYIFFLSIYRIFFHPLAKYPGPFLAKLTDSHSTYHAYHGTRHLEFYRMHEKYGPIVRYGPNHVSINSASALKTIYGHKSNVKKSMFYSVFPPTKHTFNTHSSIDKAAHARKRRVLSHAFSEGAVRSMERYVTGNIRTFCERLGGKGEQQGAVVLGEKKDGKGWGVPQNMADWCNYLTFDVMGDLCFGKAFEMLERGENRHVIDLIGNAAHMHLILGTNPLLKKLNLHRLLFPHILEARTQYMSYSKSQAQERTKLGLDTDRKDFFYYLLNARDPETGGPGFNTQELWGESNLLIIAGSDTTSTALASAFFYLVHNPSKLEVLQNEIRSTFNDVEEIHSGPELNTCTYLRAVIDESMRLSPPVGGILPREILPGGLTIDNHHFPAGVVVGTPHYTIHHNPSYYPSPFTFSPERWLPEHVGKENVSTAQSAFCPFSIGPRGCIGKGLAYAELTTALARVVFLYDFKLAEGTRVGDGSEGNREWGRQRVGEYQLKDCFTSMKEGPMVVFRERQ